MNDAQAAVRARDITRICHFTQARNLPHILDQGRLMSVDELTARNLPVNPNDKSRLDGHTDYVSVSIEYPNSWFLAVAKAREPLFHDWVVLLFDPDPLWDAETLFCPVNAATQHGSLIGSGAEAFEAMYSVSPRGSRQNRGMLHLRPCPTDDQAEALVRAAIPVGSLQGIIVGDVEQAHVEQDRLKLLGHGPETYRWYASAEMFDAHRLAGRIRSGERAEETSIVGLRR